jgi:hypothetical protein
MLDGGTVVPVLLLLLGVIFLPTVKTDFTPIIKNKCLNGKKHA